VDGWLVEPFDAPEAWARVFTDLARDPGTLRRLKAGVRPPRRTAAVADDMLSLYRRMVGERLTTERA
jgi:hypothetical protein